MVSLTSKPIPSATMGISFLETDVLPVTTIISPGDAWFNAFLTSTKGPGHVPPLHQLFLFLYSPFEIAQFPFFI